MSNSSEKNIKKSTTILFWVLAVIITLSSAIYQKKTGPTYPIDGEISFNNEQISYTLLRSHNVGKDAEVILESISNNGEAKDVSSSTGAIMEYKRYKSHDEWQTVKLASKKEDKEDGKQKLFGYIPHQPAAGKVMYRIGLYDISKDVNHTSATYLTDVPVVIRYKGAVPMFVLIPHIFFMFFAMMFSTRTGIEGISRRSHNLNFLTSTTIILLGLGGLMLGPIVQKYAFDAYWTGWPWGTDLTDNKTIVAFLFWVFAFWKVRVDKLKNTNNAWKWVVVASVALMAVYMIPHSAFGSEIDHTQAITN